MERFKTIPRLHVIFQYLVDNWFGLFVGLDLVWSFCRIGFGLVFLLDLDLVGFFVGLDLVWSFCWIGFGLIFLLDWIGLVFLLDWIWLVFLLDWIWFFLRK
jgi:hypothetical protein